jgi:hypothetical protein
MAGNFELDGMGVKRTSCADVLSHEEVWIFIVALRRVYLSGPLGCAGAICLHSVAPPRPGLNLAMRSLLDKSTSPAVTCYDIGPDCMDSLK